MATTKLETMHKNWKMFIFVDCVNPPSNEPTSEYKPIIHDETPNGMVNNVDKITSVPHKYKVKNVK